MPYQTAKFLAHYGLDPERMEKTMKLYVTVGGATPDEDECIKIALGYGANEEPCICGQVYDCYENETMEEWAAYKSGLLAIEKNGGFSAPSEHFSNTGWYWQGIGAEYRNVFGARYGWAEHPAFTTLAECCEDFEEMKIILDCLRYSHSSLRYWQKGQEGGTCASNILFQITGVGVDVNDTGLRQALIIRELIMRVRSGAVYQWAAQSSLWEGWIIGGGCQWHPVGESSISPEDYLKKVLGEEILSDERATATLVAEQFTKSHERRW
jgi:hypothetical protein